MIPTRWLILGGAVVIAICVLLIVKLSGGSGATSRRTAEPAGDAGSASDSRTRRRPRPAIGEEPVARPDTPVRETTIDGVLVRDHRKGDHPLPELPITAHPPDRRRIPPAVVQDVSARLQAVMKDCTSAIPADARGQKPRLEGVVFVDVKGGELAVTEATVQLRDVTGDVAAAKACIEQKAVGQTTAAKDVEDTTHYSITLSFAIPAP